MIHEQIKHIRGLLKVNSIHEAYDEMVSLNQYDHRADYFTCYFIHSDDVPLEYIDERYLDHIDQEEGCILVESVMGQYIPAKVRDIEDTLDEIEDMLMKEGK
jgi:hypothetical protein